MNEHEAEKTTLTATICLYFNFNLHTVSICNVRISDRIWGLFAQGTIIKGKEEKIAKQGVVWFFDLKDFMLCKYIC